MKVLKTISTLSESSWILKRHLIRSTMKYLCCLCCLYNLNFYGTRGIPLICLTDSSVSLFMTIPLYIKRSYVGFPKVQLLDLFLLYINDLFYFLHLLSVILFAHE